MLSLEKCREVLGGDCPKSDSELELLRDQLYGLADVAVEAFLEEQKRRKNSPQSSLQPEIRADEGGDGLGHVQQPASFPEAAALLSDDERAEIEERAAIMEQDGGLDGDVAERAAFSDLWRRRHKPRSD